MFENQKRIEEMTRHENIPIDKINMRLDKYNYRGITNEDNHKEYDSSNEDIIELANSIRYQGLINAITVIKSSHFKDTYDIVAGHRRFVACTLLQMKEIPCNILDNDKEAEQIYLIGLSENIQRNNLKPLEEAIGFQKYMKLFNIPSIRQLEHKVGKSHAYIHSRLFLLQQPVHIIKAVNNRELALTTLDDISTSIHNKILRDELIEFIYQKKLNREESLSLLRIVRSYEQEYLDKNKDNGVTKERLVDMDTLSMEQVFKKYNEECGHLTDKEQQGQNNLESIIKQEDDKQRIKKIGYEMKYRSRFEIVTSILMSISDNSRYDTKKRKYRGVTANKIMYLNYLSFAQIKEYTFYLIEKGMIAKHFIVEKEYQWKAKPEFIITHKGLMFLQQAIKLFKIIDSKEYADIEPERYSKDRVMVIPTNDQQEQEQQTTTTSSTDNNTR